ncbi:MAG: LLM class flavin-dependent oxidoreductase [Acidimicrobiales bacterium]|jgi:alkanesulfonate monooxygenase SsuD/methylene tetrahydromethanopterin reductase-like flavin-dependent oxidoreductase (luciferase family)
MTGPVLRQGLFFPPFDALADPRLVADIGAEAEKAGWDGIFLWDHLLYSEPVREILDPWICLAAIAMVTERIRLGPMVTPLARRRPTVLTRQAATLDRLSGGRLVLGFGLGDDGDLRELSRFGELADPAARGEALTEGLEVVAGLLSGKPVHHVGTHYTVDDVSFLPAHTQPGGIPFWLAARWPNLKPLHRAVGYDGVFTIGIPGPEQLAEWSRSIAAMAPRAGFEVVVSGRPGDDPSPWSKAGATWWLTQLGPYDLDVDEVRAVVRAGPHRLQGEPS